MKLISFGLFLTISAFWLTESEANTCCFGYESIDGLNDGNCYRLLIELGPMANNQARVACGAMFGGKLITLKSKEDIEIVQKHFLDKYGSQLTGHPLAAKDTGYWTGYLRDSHLEAYNEKFVHDFFDAYSFEPLPAEFWRPGQPDNKRFLSNRTDEVCVTRKKIANTATKDKDRGLDDYPCGKQHWALCMLPGAVADQSNQNIYNTAWQNYQPDVDPNVCLEDWNEQNVQFFEMLIKKEQAKGNRKGIRKAQSQQGIQTATITDMTALVESDIISPLP